MPLSSPADQFPLAALLSTVNCNPPGGCSSVIGNFRPVGYGWGFDTITVRYTDENTEDGQPLLREPALLATEEGEGFGDLRQWPGQGVPVHLARGADG